MKRRLLSLLMVLAFMIIPIAGCQSFDGEAVVVEVGDVQVPVRLANFYARQQQAMTETYYASLFGDNMWSTEMEEGVSFEQSTKDSIMESIESLYILDAHAAEFEVVLSDEDVANIEKAAKAFAANNGLTEKEAVSGDEETVREYLRLRTIEARMFEAMTVDVDREVADEDAAQKKMQYVLFTFSSTDAEGNSVDMTDEEKEELKIEAENTLEEAKDVEDLLAFGEEAGLIANEITFDSESTTPNVDLIAAVDVLEVGQFTDIIEADNGFFFGKLVSDFDQDATDEKKETIVQERQQKSFDAQIATWREATTITVHKNVWNKVDFQRVGVTIRQQPTESTTGQ